MPEKVSEVTEIGVVEKPVFRVSVFFPLTPFNKSFADVVKSECLSLIIIKKQCLQV